jgi:hypothetical protein
MEPARGGPPECPPPECHPADGSCSFQACAEEDGKMPASASRSLHQPERFGRLWWLPSNGLGNGLDDVAWAPLADIAGSLVPGLLARFRAANVPAYAAPAAPPSRRARRARRAGQASQAGRAGAVGQPRRRERDGDQMFRIWVGTSAYGRAEETLRVALPALLTGGS